MNASLTLLLTLWLTLVSVLYEQQPFSNSPLSSVFGFKSCPVAKKTLSSTVFSQYYLWLSPGNLYLIPGWDSKYFPKSLGRSFEHAAVAKSTIFLSVTTEQTGSRGCQVSSVSIPRFLSLNPTPEPDMMVEVLVLCFKSGVFNVFQAKDPKLMERRSENPYLYILYKILFYIKLVL